MDKVYAQIELINSCDLALVRRHIIDTRDVKRAMVKMVVSPNTLMLCINEQIQQYLQLPIVDKKIVQLANDHLEECNVAGPVEIKFKNRSTTCRAIVLPGNSNPILGRIPITSLDVVVDPQSKELILNPLNRPMVRVKMKVL